MELKRQKIVVVGAGPVGALAALYAAKRGHDVEVYEMRNDLRDPNTTPFNFTKSINLALSERGIRALQHAGYDKLVNAILADTIPMHGRMIHSIDGGGLVEKSQKYDVHGRFIRASDRADLNHRLLDELERQPNVKLLFNRKLTGCDFDKKLAWFEIRDMSKGYSKHGERPSEVEINFDLMIGADGAYSAVRFHLMKFARIQYQQEYIDTLWCEFHMPALHSHDQDHRTHQYPISPNHLHIWPGGSFMFIAIPSTNKTFTCTLFMPASMYVDVDRDPSSLVPFFEKSFPGVLPDLIDSAELVKQYKANPHLPLISIKCQPYHYESSVVILGDAAHAMVPFYGQGMNAGLEDVRVLFEILDKHQASSARLVSPARARAAPPRPGPESLQEPSSSSSSFAAAAAAAVEEKKEEEEKAEQQRRGKALQEYTAQRVLDAHAINDLAMGNYQEMRSDVQSPLYLVRKGFEERLDWYLPALDIATQYTRVSFSNERYSDVIKSVRRQRLIFNISAGVSTVVVAIAAAWAWRSSRRL